jgi:hypothetical protein
MALMLIPTVELEPSGWAEPEYQELIGTAQWDEFWERALSRWHVKPVSTGAWHVSTDLLETEDTLAKLLTLELRGIGVQGFPDEDGGVAADEERVSALAGGYVLLDAAGRTVAFPSCCCDLGDLGAWRRAANLVDGEGFWLDIGHGNRSAHREGAGVVLTESPEMKGFEPVAALVSADELLAASYVAERALEAFRLRLLPILRQLVEDGARAERLSLLMVGLPVG